MAVGVFKFVLFFISLLLLNTDKLVTSSDLEEYIIEFLLLWFGIILDRVEGYF